MRRSLFVQLFLRVLGLIALAVGVVVFLSHVYQLRQVDAAWRRDLQQQAEWMARHWGPATLPAAIKRPWARTHAGVRLVITDASGAVVADSAPEQTPLDADGSGRMLIGSAPIRLAGGIGTLTLARRPESAFPGSVHVEFVLAAVTLLLLAGLTVLPVLRGASRSLERVGALARRIADGRFGETLAAPPQRELASLVEAVNAMSVRLEQEEDRRRRLLADVSHELRSPLARLQALVDTAARHPGEGVTLHAGMVAEIALMDRLVGDMLDSVRLEAGRAAVECRPEPLGAWVRDVFARLRVRIEAAGIACTTTVEPTGTSYPLDGERLVQALANVVENAITAVASRPAPHIDLGFARAPEGWVLRVVDNGRGIPASELPFVFDRFHRVDAGRDRRRGGVGLGLSIARAVIEAHGGQIALASVEGRGTTATIVLPDVPSVP